MDKKRLKHFVYTIRSMLPLVNTFTGKRCIEKRGLYYIGAKSIIMEIITIF